MLPAKLRLTYLFILCGLFLTLCGCQSQEPSSAAGSTPAITVVASAASSNLHAEQTEYLSFLKFRNKLFELF